MRYISICSVLFWCFMGTVSANWQKISDVDYIWGPFKIYNLSLFTETGEYQEKFRPLMLTLHYAKPVDGRDFAISLARSWANLGIKLDNQEDIIDRLRKIMPNIKKNDKLSYIALEDKGYFVLNDMVIDEEFNQAFNDAVVAIWLDPRVEIGRKLIESQRGQQPAVVQIVKPEVVIPEKNENLSTNIHNDSVQAQAMEKVVSSAKENTETVEIKGEVHKPEKRAENSVEDTITADKVEKKEEGLTEEKSTALSNPSENVVQPFSVDTVEQAPQEKREEILPQSETYRDSTVESSQEDGIEENELLPLYDPLPEWQQTAS